MLSRLPTKYDPNLIIGFATYDDVGAYRIADNRAIVQNVDFITPVVDDPFRFGQIAAANALSDLYAKGVRPLMAMNIVCFPVSTIGLNVLSAILRGGYDKLLEADVALAGGHTLEDSEPKYGLAVVGISRVDGILTNSRARPGDVLILTKPLGSGIIVAAIKAMNSPGNDVLEISKGDIETAVSSMTMLNRDASDIMMHVGAHACTDITGFGLLGHLYEMISASQVGAVLNMQDVPILPGARGCAEQSLVSSANWKNEMYLESHTQWLGEAAVSDRFLLYGAETSGGLLMAVDREKASTAVELLLERGIPGVSTIGYVTEGPVGMILVT